MNYTDIIKNDGESINPYNNQTTEYMSASTTLKECKFTSCMIYGEDKTTVPSFIISQEFYKDNNG